MASQYQMLAGKDAHEVVPRESSAGQMTQQLMILKDKDKKNEWCKFI